MQTGGIEGLKENYNKVISRVQSFGRYIFDITDYSVIGDLFNSERFQYVAKQTCPSHKRVLDPFQFNFIMQIPGQTVPIHIDGIRMCM